MHSQFDLARGLQLSIDYGSFQRVQKKFHEIGDDNICFIRLNYLNHEASADTDLEGNTISIHVLPSGIIAQ